VYIPLFILAECTFVSVLNGHNLFGFCFYQLVDILAELVSQLLQLIFQLLDFILRNVFLAQLL